MSMDIFAYAETYPNRAGHKGYRDTGRASARSATRTAPKLRQMCLDQLRSHSELTADEIAQNLGIDKLSIRPRCSELAALNQITDSGKRRRNSSGKNAVCWRLA